MIKKIRVFLKKNFLISAIIFLALLVRFIGIYPGFNMYHPDEPILYGTAIKMINEGSLNPGRFDYPDGSHLIHYLIFKNFLVPVGLAKIFIENPDSFFSYIFEPIGFFKLHQVDIFGQSNLSALFLSRYTTAIIGTITVFLTYYLGRKLFNTATGLFAAFFLAFSYRHVLASHLTLTDAPNTLFLLLALISIYHIWKKNSLSNYIIGGVFLGLYFSIKYQIFPVFSFIFVHLYWVIRNKNFFYIFSKKAFIALFFMIAVFAMLNTYFFIDFQKALAEIQWVSRKYQSGVMQFNFYPIYYLFYWGITPPVFIVIILGILVAIFRNFLKSLFLLVTLIPFLFIFLYFVGGGTYVRNFTTITPILAIFAGYLFSFIFIFLQKKINTTKAGIVSVLLLIFINHQAIINSFTLSFNYNKSWNRDVLAKWASKNLSFSDKIANDNLALEYDKYPDMTRWEIQEENSISELRDLEIQFAVGNIFWHYNLSYWWFGLPQEELIKYREMPYVFLDNTYAGVALSEQLDNIIFEVHKPWQAPEFSYYVVKVPYYGDDLGKEKAHFDFIDNQENFKTTEIQNSKIIDVLNWDNNGFEGNGSLVFIRETDATVTTRIESPVIEVTEEKLYTVKAFLKTDQKLEKRQRDGFIRVDFFNSLENQRDGGVKKAVSSMVYGSDQWQEKEVKVVSPKGAKYMTVSLQRVYPFRPYNVWIDNIRIYEADFMEDSDSKLPYIKSTMPKNILYPNSFM